MTINGDYQRLVADREELLRSLLLRVLSKRALKTVKMRGRILVNQIERTVRHPLRVGDVVELYYPDERAESQVEPWYFPLHIVYEDEAFLVVNKPAGMASIPNRRYPNYTLANALTGYYEMQGIPSKVHLVSRLDKQTSGLLLVAKNRRMQHLVMGQVSRRYVFLVEGQMEGQGTLMLPIASVAGTTQRIIDCAGKQAITHYRVLSQQGPHTLVEASLETGRTHQIRVHLAHLGHPLVGDRLYGKAHPYFQGQALHSYYLCFKHTLTQKTLRFEAWPYWLKGDKPSR